MSADILLFPSLSHPREVELAENIFDPPFRLTPTRCPICCVMPKVECGELECGDTTEGWCATCSCRYCGAGTMLQAQTGDTEIEAANNAVREWNDLVVSTECGGAIFDQRPNSLDLRDMAYRLLDRPRGLPCRQPSTPDGSDAA